MIDRLLHLFFPGLVPEAERVIFKGSVALIVNRETGERLTEYVGRGPTAQDAITSLEQNICCALGVKIVD